MNSHEQTTVLRVVACGSVGAGKTALIERLWHDAKLPAGDLPAARDVGCTGRAALRGVTGFALLLGGAGAQDERGGATAVARCEFTTARRSFVVADVPGGERSTRETLCAAADADLALIVVDARDGVLAPTRRDTVLAHLAGIRKVVLAINQIDRVDFSEHAYRAIAGEYLAFAAQVGVPEVVAIPLCALHGDNVVARSERTPWYDGPTLLEHLESVEVDGSRGQSAALRLPVQAVDRAADGTRHVCGTIAGGALRPGDRVRIQPSGRESSVRRIVVDGGDRQLAVAGESITLALADAIDVACGDTISEAGRPAEVADQFEATLVWLGDEPMLPGRLYEMRIGTCSVSAAITESKYKLKVDTLEHLATKTLERDEIGVCNVSLDAAVAFDPFAVNRDTGGFVLIDRRSDATVGAGMLHFALRRAHNIHLQYVDIDKAARATLNGQRPALIWMTGLSGAGKSTIANLVEKKLYAMGRRSYLLDGDNVRHGLNRDLGFTDADRVENVRRVAEVARLMVDAGLIVIAAFISPFRAERAMARGLLAAGEFVEVHVDTPLEVAESRDAKGLYKKARRGELRNFTGIDSSYEAPENPELRIDAATCSAEQAAAQVIDKLRALGLI